MGATDSDASAGSTSSRGVGFPVLPLDAAATVLHQAGKYGFQHSLDAFAHYLGSSTTNSGSFKRKIASLKDFKLVTVSRESVAITPVGQRIAMPVDEGDEKVAIREAFESCRVFAHLYDLSAKGVELDLEMLGNSAVRNLRVGAPSRSKFIESFARSAVAAGLARREGSALVLQPPSQQVTEPGWPSTSQEPEKESLAEATRTRETSRSVPVALSQTWQAGEFELSFEVSSPHPLPAAAYARVAEVVSAISSLGEALEPRTADQEQN